MATQHIETADGLDDAYERQDGGVFDNSGTTVQCNAAAAAGSRHIGGYRFEGVIPAVGDTINSATMDISASSTAVDDPNVDIHLHDVDAPANFSDEADVLDRPRTTASVQWTTTGIGTGRVTTPNFATPCQEWRDRAGGGSVLCVLMVGRSDATAAFRTVSYDSDTARAADLDLDYTEAAGGSIIPLIMHHRRIQGCS